MKITKVMLEQIIREEATKIQKMKILKEERATIIKQLNELYEEDEIVDEGLFSSMTGVDKIKNNWKFAFGFYQKVQPKLAAFLAKNALVAEQSGWNMKVAKKEINAILNLADTPLAVAKGTSGQVAAGGMGGTAIHTGDPSKNQWVKELYDNMKKNPNMLDAEIQKFAPTQSATPTEPTV